MPDLPLAGIRVADLTISWAGPHGTTLLGDMGAEVIRVESIQYPDPLRAAGQVLVGRRLDGYPNKEAGARPWNRNAFYNSINRNKYGITLDLTRPKGVELFKRLVSMSDVVTESYRPRVKRNFGLTYEALKKVKEDIIMISSCGFGQTGLYSEFPYWGPSGEAMAGHASIRGYPDRYPVRAQGAWSDPLCGIYLALGVMAALHYRAQTGKGQYIDLAQVECTAVQLGEVFMDYVMNDRVWGMVANDDPAMAPHGCYRCAGENRWVAIAVTRDEEWNGLCEAMDKPLWTQDTRFGDALGRWHNREALNKLVEEWTLQHEQYEIMHTLQRAGVPAAVVVNSKQLYEDPQLNARGVFPELTHSDAGTHRYLGKVWEYSKTPMKIVRPASLLGEHNDYVLTTILGLSKGEIDELEHEKIIGTVPAML